MKIQSKCEMWHAMKAVVKKKSIVVNAYVRKERFLTQLSTLPL